MAPGTSVAGTLECGEALAPVAQIAIAPQHFLSVARIALGFCVYSDLDAHATSSWALPAAVGAVALDIADGRVARARGTSSAAGRLVDNASDAAFLAFCFSAFAPEIGVAPLIFFTLAFGSYAARGLLSALSGAPLSPSPRGHWAGVANYALAVVGAITVHPLLHLPGLLIGVSAAAVTLLNAVAFYDNLRLAWRDRSGRL